MVKLGRNGENETECWKWVGMVKSILLSYCPSTLVLTGNFIDQTTNQTYVNFPFFYPSLPSSHQWNQNRKVMPHPPRTVVVGDEKNQRNIFHINQPLEMCYPELKGPSKRKKTSKIDCDIFKWTFNDDWYNHQNYSFQVRQQNEGVLSPDKHFQVRGSPCLTTWPTSPSWTRARPGTLSLSVCAIWVQKDNQILQVQVKWLSIKCELYNVRKITFLLFI